ncbi:recombination protein NinB [Halomonas sp. E14]|uniref:recombination protein NinB n=1 Tax=Halomonas sp. E14 TaxID=3397245 RepID=UPI00403EBC30
MNRSASANQVEYVIQHPGQLAPVMSQAMAMAGRGLRGGPVRVVLTRIEEKRTDSQNKKLWPMLSDLSTQVVWHGVKMAPHEWKDLATAALKRHRMVPGMDGGFVMVGLSTSRMSKRVFCDLIECLYAFGTEQGVQWSEPALALYEEYKEARQ